MKWSTYDSWTCVPSQVEDSYKDAPMLDCEQAPYREPVHSLHQGQPHGTCAQGTVQKSGTGDNNFVKWK